MQCNHDIRVDCRKEKKVTYKIIYIFCTLHHAYREESRPRLHQAYIEESRPL